MIRTSGCEVVVDITRHERRRREGNNKRWRRSLITAFLVGLIFFTILGLRVTETGVKDLLGARSEVLAVADLAYDEGVLTVYLLGYRFVLPGPRTGDTTRGE